MVIKKFETTTKTTIMTQNENILNHLKKGNKITPLEALNLFGCFRLSARIHDLRDLGNDIKAMRITKGNKNFCQYSLI